MEYRIEILDENGLRLRWLSDVPLLDVYYGGADEAPRISGLLPGSVERLRPGYGIRVFIEGTPVAEARVISVSPVWGDARKLVLDDYIRFHEVTAFEALGTANRGDTEVWRRFDNKEVSALVKQLLQSAPGSIHYRVDHTAYPGGALREFQKFAARAAAETALANGSIDTGVWAGPGRVDATAAYAIDGNTIAGLEVDGVAWPDLRLMMLDAEEVSLNARAIARHPEVASWSEGQYNASGYALRAEAAQAELQARIDAWGIQYVELNAHTDAQGVYDHRVDVDGRYVGLAYGGAYCLGPALIEKGLCGVQLHEDGAFLSPAWQLKDYLSYGGTSDNTVDASGVTLSAFEARGSVLEALAALCYAGGRFTFSVDMNNCVHFRKADAPARLIDFDPAKHAVVLGADDSGFVNSLTVTGHPDVPFAESQVRDESIAAYGSTSAELAHFGFSRAADAVLLTTGLLDDLAYPEPSGRIEFFGGDAGLSVGDGLVLYGGKLRRLDSPETNEWGGTFAGVLAGRVRALRHLCAGTECTTIAHLGSPLRSVRDPLRYLVRSQEDIADLSALRLDAESTGLESGWHLD